MTGTDCSCRRLATWAAQFSRSTGTGASRPGDAIKQNGTMLACSYGRAAYCNITTFYTDRAIFTLHEKQTESTVIVTWERAFRVMTFVEAEFLHARCKLGFLSDAEMDWLFMMPLGGAAMRAPRTRGKRTCQRGTVALADGPRQRFKWVSTTCGRRSGPWRRSIGRACRCGGPPWQAGAIFVQSASTCA